MKFCLMHESITPQQPVFMAGFGLREHKSEGTIDDLYAKVVLLHANQALLIITLDVLGGDRSFVTGIKTALYEGFGLTEEQILINFSHTHSSVFVTGEDPDQRRGNYCIGQEKWQLEYSEEDYQDDIHYFRFIREKVVRMVKKCFTDLQEGTVMFGQGTSLAGVNRRVMTDTGIKFMPNYTGEIDSDLFVLKLIDTHDITRGILFCYACHPTCMSNYLLSAEFVGHACIYLEEIYPDSTAVFMQGCAADIHPLKAADGNKFKSCTIEEMQEAGIELGKDVETVLKREAFTAINGPFQTKQADAKLYTEVWDVDKIEQHFLHDETKDAFRKRAAKILIASIGKGTDRKHFPCCILVWDLDEKTKLVAIEGEVPSGYSIMIKKLFKDYKVITLGYSNGLPTYIPTRKMLQEGGYESEAYILHGFRGPLIAENEDIIIGTIARMKLLN